MMYHSKRAGQSTRDMAEKRYKKRLWFVLLAAGVIFVILLAAYNYQILGLGGAGFLGLIILARFLTDIVDSKAGKMMKEERRATRGAKAEERIGAELSNLGEGYLVLHDISSPYGNIDHIVISRYSGIFLIETKAHGGKVSVAGERLLVNGHEPEKDFIVQALKNTYLLKEVIGNVAYVDVWIKPIVVFTNAFVERTPPLEGVTIINKKFLLAVLQRSDPKAQSLAIWESRERIVEALRGQELHISPSEIHPESKPTIFECRITEMQSPTPRCPKCGGEMVLRTAKNGPNQGGKFWGCSDFPRCRGIVTYDEQAA